MSKYICEITSRLEMLEKKHSDFYIRYQKLYEKEKILRWKGTESSCTLSLLEGFLRLEEENLNEIKMIRNLLK